MTGQELDEKAIFNVARKIESAEARAEYLQQACGADEALLARVGTLLSAYEEQDSFLESPPGSGDSPTVVYPTLEQPGDTIGPYRLLQQIGEGGMGVVYMAEQTEPVERRVALKIIKPGMDTRKVIARFEAERQALAMMDHPNIAKVHDAGTTQTGRPYFVMELVKGVPVTQYCDEKQLTLGERLELFVPICQAVQHAHQKGIIHRDIKPSNVLVAEYDDRPVPKVIDFGVAKAIEQQLTEKTVFTEFGQVVGTPEYMSPEQAKLNQLDIDTRTDVYSLGVLLYELLTGETPFDRERMRSAAFDELLRIIREEEPPRPSLRLSSSDALPSIAASRHVEPKQLSALVHGELDWIVMRALEKDRARRYDTANGLSRDIERYLSDEPVEACPPSAVYRFRKFARRNKATLAVIASALLILTAVAIASTIAAGSFRTLASRLERSLIAETNAKNAARDAQQEAERARDGEETLRKLAEQQTELAQQQRDRANANAARARRAVDEYLSSVTDEELLSAPGLQSLRRQLLAAALDFYAEFANEQSDDPRLQGEVASAYQRLARIHREIGNTDASQAANQEAIRMLESLRDASSAREQELAILAEAYFAAGRYDDAIRLCQEVLEENPDATTALRTLADAYNTLASREDQGGGYADVLQLHQKAFQVREKLVLQAPDNAGYNAELAATLNNIGVLLNELGNTAEALAMYQQAVDYGEKACGMAPHSITWGRWLGTSNSNVGHMQRNLGNQSEALKAFQRQTSVWRRLVAQNPAVTYLRGDYYKALLLLADQQQRMGLTTEAKRSRRDARDVLAELDRSSPEETFRLATVYAELAARPDGSQASGEDDPDAEDERERNAELAVQTLWQAIDAGWAVPEALESYEVFDSIRQRDDFQTFARFVNANRLVANKANTGEKQLDELVEDAGRLKELHADSPDKGRRRSLLTATLHAIGVIQTKLKLYDEAENSLTEALRLQQQLSSERGGDPQTELDALGIRISLAQLQWADGRRPAAHKTYQICLDELRQLADATPSDTAFAQRIAAEQRTICQRYAKLGLLDEASDVIRRAVAKGSVDAFCTDSRFGVLLASESEGFSRYFHVFVPKWKRTDAGKVLFLTSMVPDTEMEPGELRDLAKTMLDKRADFWTRFLAATAEYRAGRFQEALQQLDASGIGDVALYRDYWRALILAKLGRGSDAMDCLALAETRYRDQITQTTEAWHLIAYTHLIRREAWAEIKQRTPDDYLLHLIQARGYRSIGEIEKSERELAAATAAAPSDVDVWTARAKLIGQWDDEKRAESAWQKAVEIGDDDPMSWIRRGRWYDARGEYAKADADFAHAVTLTKSPDAHAAVPAELSRSFVGHEGPVRSVVFSPDGRYVLSASGWPEGDGTLRLWHVATGVEVRRFVGHTAPANYVDFSPDGQHALSSSLDQTVRLWDVASGKELLVLRGHKSAVNDVVFTRDGRRALSASEDRTVRLWDLETGEELHRFDGHIDIVTGLSLSADGSHFLSASFDKTVSLWDLESGEELRRYNDRSALWVVAFLPNDNRFLASGDDGTISLWSVDSDQPLRRYRGHSLQVFGMDVSTDGSRILSGSGDGTVRLWDVETGRELHCYRGHSEVVWSVAIDPKGQYAASGGGGLVRDGEWLPGTDWEIRLWRISNMNVDSALPNTALQSEEIQRSPTNPALWIARARLYADAQAWDEAAADWAQAIQLSNDSPLWNSPRKTACLQLAGLPEVFSRVVEILPEEKTLWIARGQYQVLRSNWPEAKNAYARAFPSASIADEAIFDYAAVLLLEGNKEVYEQLCGQLATQAAVPHDSFSDFVLARICGIGPAENVDPQRLVAWAIERKKESDEPWVLHNLGLAQCRAGQFEAAIESLEKSNASNWPESSKAQNWLVMAMAYHQLGNTKSSRRCLEAAHQILDQANPQKDQPVAVPVTDWLEIQLLRREAELLIIPHKADQAEQKKAPEKSMNP